MVGLGPNLWPKATSIWNTHTEGLGEEIRENKQWIPMIIKADWLKEVIFLEVYKTLGQNFKAERPSVFSKSCYKHHLNTSIGAQRRLTIFFFALTWEFNGFSCHVLPSQINKEHEQEEMARNFLWDFPLF